MFLVGSPWTSNLRHCLTKINGKIEISFTSLDSEGATRQIVRIFLNLNIFLNKGKLSSHVSNTVTPCQTCYQVL